MATTRYVWEKWNCIAAQEYVGKITNERWTVRSNGSLSFYDNIYVNPKTGKVTLSGNVGSTGWDEWHTWECDYRHCSYQYYDNGPDNDNPQVHVFDKKLKVVQQLVYSKGDNSYGNASSTNANAYVSNGKVGDYWYVSKGSDNIDPTALTYSDAVTAGQPVTLTIAPSTGTTLGGNISYVIQTTTNGTDWYDAGETSGTSYTVTVPADAIVWNVRVYAKDDTGFTSSTYIYGNGVDTYVNVIRVGISPDSGDIGYITSPQVMFVSVNTDAEYTFTVKLDGETLSSSSSSSSSTIQHIILSEEKFNSLKEETKYTLTIEIVQSGATITRTYTFKKFVYDDTTLGGVMEGAGKALRIKRKIQSQIVGANIPKEIIKIDNPIGVSDLAAATASEAQVLKGYTFFSGDNELKTGTLSGMTKVAQLSIDDRLSPTSNNATKTYTINTDFTPLILRTGVDMQGEVHTNVSSDGISYSVYVYKYIEGLSTKINNTVYSKFMGLDTSLTYQDKDNPLSFDVKFNGNTVTISVTAWSVKGTIYVYGI